MRGRDEKKKIERRCHVGRCWNSIEEVGKRRQWFPRSAAELDEALVLLSVRLLSQNWYTAGSQMPRRRSQCQIGRLGRLVRVSDNLFYRADPSLDINFSFRGRWRSRGYVGEEWGVGPMEPQSGAKEEEEKKKREKGERLSSLIAHSFSASTLHLHAT